MATPAGSSSSLANGSGLIKEEDIDVLLGRLGFDEDEVDDLIFEEENDVPKEGVKWMALARIHTTNRFSS